MADIMAMFGAPIGGEDSFDTGAASNPSIAKPAAAVRAPASFQVASDENAPLNSGPTIAAGVTHETASAKPPANQHHGHPQTGLGLSLAVFCDDENAPPARAPANENDENAENAAPSSYVAPRVSAAAAACEEHDKPRSILGPVPGIPLEPLEYVVGVVGTNGLTDAIQKLKPDSLPADTRLILSLLLGFILMTLMRVTRGGWISPCRLPRCRQSLHTRHLFFGLQTTVGVIGFLATQQGLAEGSTGARKH